MTKNPKRKIAFRRVLMAYLKEHVFPTEFANSEFSMNLDQLIEAELERMEKEQEQQSTDINEDLMS